MKIRPDDYEKLKKAVIHVVSQCPDSSAAYKDAGLSARRYRWDILRATKLKIGDSVGAPGDLNLYDYMNDDHIDTALKAAVKDAGVEAW